MNRHARRPAVAALAALGLAATFTLAAHAPEGCYVALEGDPATEEDDVFACEQETWFHRATTHAGNAGFVDPTGTHGLATFDTTPPAGSVTGGNGGGYLATQALDNDGDLVEAEFTGSFTGVLDSLDIDLHTLVGSEANGQGNQSIRVVLTVDDATIHSGDMLDVPAVVEEASEAGSRRLDFGITGIAALLDSFDFPNGPETEHTVTLEVGVHYTNHAVIFAFDTTEVPGGITFNALEPDATVSVDLS